MKYLLSFLLFLTTFSFTSAQSNYSLSFDGVDDFVDCGVPNENFNITNDSLTWYFSFKLLQTTSNAILASQEIGGGSQNKWLIFYQPDNNRFGIHVYGPGLGSQWMYSEEIELNNDDFYQFKLTKTGYEYNFYLNDDFIGAGSGSSNIPFVDANLLFGDGWENFHGLIDEIKIWDTLVNDISNSSFDSNLIGYWNFNEGEGTTLTDLSSNDNNGTINGASWSNDAPPAPQELSPNHSLSFDGVDDNVSVSGEIFNNMEAFSFQSWFYSDGEQSGHSNIIQTNSSLFFARYQPDGQFKINFHIESIGRSFSFDPPEYNSWNNIAFTWNGQICEVFLNGESIGTEEITGTYTTEGDDLFYLGNFETNEGFKGNIDEVSIWNTALTQDQIQAYMNTSLSGSESGLVGYWNFNDGEGSTLTDLSGNGNHGTINGATWSDDGAPVQPLEELDTIATITLSDVDTYIFPGYIGDTALVAVNADLGDIDLYSSEMHFTGFQGVLGFEGIVTEGTPMGDADWNVIVNEQEEVLITGNYGSDAISGDVTLFYLQFSVGDSLAEDSIAIQLAHVELNEEEGVIETMDGSVSVGHLLFGDVTQNDDVSMMDAANVLRYLVGSVDFDTYQMSAADVTMDESISALDASVIGQYALSIINSLPHSEGTDGGGDIVINGQLQYQPGELLEVPIMLANGNNLLSFEVDLTYDPNQVTVEGIDWSDQIAHFMIEENNEPGSIRVAGSGTTPDGQEGLFAMLRLQVLETTTEQSIDLTINKIRINESAPIEDVMVTITQEVLSTDNSTVPTVYALHQNYPNPFNPTTKISYDLPEASVVSLSIYDLMGREIRTMINSEQTAGFKNIQWNATDNLGKSVPAGMYIYTIQAGEFRQTRKMVLLK